MTKGDKRERRERDGERRDTETERGVRAVGGESTRATDSVCTLTNFK